MSLALSAFHDRQPCRGRPSRSPAGPTPAIETMIRSRVSCLASMYPSFHAPAPPSTQMSYHIRQRRPAVEAATATAGRQRVIGHRRFSDTSGVSSLTPTPSPPLRLVWSLIRSEPPLHTVPRPTLTAPATTSPPCTDP